MFGRIVVAFTLSVVVAGPPVLAGDLYGAIAYSLKSGRYGYLAGAPTREKAQQEALRGCRVADCTIQVWFRNSCGAVAIGNRGSVTGWGWAPTQPVAESNALAECRKRGKRCHVIVATCALKGASNQSGAGKS
jgi:serine/threonine-protein kinase